MHLPAASIKLLNTSWSRDTPAPARETEEETESMAFASAAPTGSLLLLLLLSFPNPNSFPNPQVNRSDFVYAAAEAKDQRNRSARQAYDVLFFDESITRKLNR